MNKKLAKIESAGLEIKERGILTFHIQVQYEDGCCQAVGGLSLDTYDSHKKERVGTAYGCEMIRRLLLTLNVNDFSEMKGKVVWIFGEGEGLSFTPRGIQRLRVEGGKVPLLFKEVSMQFGIE